MNTLYIDKKGNLFLEDNFNGSQKKVDTIKYYLDCPLRLEDGVTFEILFNNIMSEVEIMDVIFSETMGPYKLESFIEEWEKPFITSNVGLGIEYLRLRKVLEYLEIDNNKGFVDIRVEFDGVGNNNGMDYSLEFMSLTEMKKLPLKIEEDIQIKRSVSKKDGEEVHIGGNCVITLFEIIGTLLYEITFYGTPKERDDKKQKLMDTIDSKNLINVLELQLKEAVKIENYEEAENLKNLIDKYKNLGENL